MPSDPATDHLTEERARDLLRRAASTIPVRPAAPLAAPARPHWPLLAAAAAVAVLVVGAALLGARGGTSSGPTPAPAPPAPRAATVPSVFGLTRGEATSRLEGAGLTVVDRPRVECEVDGQAIGTVPVTGEPVPADGQVVLSYADTSAADLDCPSPIALRARAWDVLGWLDGRRPAPAFADRVTVLRGGMAPDLLTAEQAVDPATLDVDVLRSAMTAPDATMVAVDRPPRHCETQVETGGPGGSYLGIGLGHYLAQQAYSTCLSGIELHYTDGRIDQVATTASDVVGIPVGSVLPVPDAPVDAAVAGFLDFLAGRGPAPVFADQVAVQVDDGPPQELSSERAGDVRRWSGGTDLRETVITRLDEPGAAVSNQERPGGLAEAYCGTAPPRGTRDRLALSLVLDSDTPVDGGSTVVDGVIQPSEASCRTTVDLFRDDSGAVDTVVVGTRPLPRADARSTVTVADGVPGPAADAGVATVGFAAYHGPRPPLAGRVRLFLGNDPIATVDAAALRDPAAWRGCPPGVTLFRGAGCPASYFSPITNPTANGIGLEVTTDPPELPCRGSEVDRPLPDDVTALRMVAIVSAEPTCSSAGELQLYVDDEGRIAAVNLLLSEP